MEDVKLTGEDRANMISFIRSMFKDKAPTNMAKISDEELSKLWNEAYNYSD